MKRKGRPRKKLKTISNDTPKKGLKQNTVRRDHFNGRKKNSQTHKHSSCLEKITRCRKKPEYFAVEWKHRKARKKKIKIEDSGECNESVFPG